MSLFEACYICSARHCLVDTSTSCFFQTVNPLCYSGNSYQALNAETV